MIFPNYVNDQSKEKFHSPPDPVGTFSKRPLYAPSLVEFCLKIIFCDTDCIGGKLSQAVKKKNKTGNSFLAACRQWVAQGGSTRTRIEQAMLATIAINVLSLQETVSKIVTY